MRTITRGVVNLALILIATGIDLWLTTQKAYHHASHHGRIAMLIAPAAVAFVAACIALAVIPSKAKLARRRPARPALPYATSPRRGR